MVDKGDERKGSVADAGGTSASLVTVIPDVEVLLIVALHMLSWR